MSKCLKPTFHGRCRWCKACNDWYVRQWVFRMILESLDYPADEVTFLTLTYNDEHYPGSVKEAKEGFQRFMKRLRKLVPKLRFVSSIERGDENGRLHWHMILYGVPFTDINKYYIRKAWSDPKSQKSIGFIKWKLADSGAMAYVMKYVLKSRLLRHEGMHDCGVMLMSRKPGIGAGQVENLRQLLNDLSQGEVSKLRGPVNSVFSWDTPMSMKAFRSGGYYYPVHRYLKDRLKIPTLPGSWENARLIYEVIKYGTQKEE